MDIATLVGYLAGPVFIVVAVIAYRRERAKRTATGQPPKRLACTWMGLVCGGGSLVIVCYGVPLIAMLFGWDKEGVVRFCEGLNAQHERRLKRPAMYPNKFQRSGRPVGQDTRATQDKTTTAGVMVTRGLACAEVKDYVTAAQWFRKAAECGDLYGMSNLGACYTMGWGVSQDYAEGLKWIRKASDGGNELGMFNLGECYRLGQGVPQDDAEARRWYHKAAEAGNLQSMAILGATYACGLGVTEDWAEGVKWLRKAAEGGHPAGMAMLGEQYWLGQGVPQDYTEAVKWHRKAAEAGSPSGMYGLGNCYAYGHGVSKDGAEALKWYRKAADAGHEDAQQVMKALEGQ